LCKYVVNDANYTVYAAVPPLIYMDFDANKDKMTHKLIKYPAEYIKISKQLDMYDVLNMSPLYLHYKQLKIKITYFAILLFLISFIAGYAFSKNSKKYFTIAIILYLLVDMLYSKNTASILTVIILVITFVLLGNKISKYTKP